MKTPPSGVSRPMAALLILAESPRAEWESLRTNNQDRVKTAWQYIYSHGCTGKKTHLRSEDERKPAR
jgi:hypothetical protein